MLVPPFFSRVHGKKADYRLFQPVWLFQQGYILIIRGTTCTGAWTEVKEEVNEVKEEDGEMANIYKYPSLY